ncbi:glycosyl transferase family protein [Mycobacterium haemophilum DSM 44634]|uniref:Glycosyl transferase family 1 n=1 Tax=Mycobacterium haemophilum TaxID=29311 RepID=A0A0I9YP79_9MYCO|nr:glycosyltransferase [Mycobacterium haemophilum]AKN15800.1 glycosyl transferase family 1 [Mycobacterium haemophilum DSM 44634]KLO31241.1 glycosyl transferase family 1 [Mycobacterium haemophilum]KLO36163.1 glycosyl transferase family 1 [Mycobacterium haemophilum]KLO42012.1 glycosyl transferase family 1 [Mycobacterium haemophilum]KLO49923.1 glycosyl transferase family 1 [Mycobacterium haemophilum]
MSTAPDAGAEPAPRRLRILFFGEAVTLAHVVRPYVLAQSLDPSRYEVHFACDPRYNKLLGAFPFRHHPIHTITSERFHGNLVQGRFYSTRALRKYVEEDTKVLAEVAPDLVVGDLRISLSVSARLAGVPYIAIANAYWSPQARRRGFPLPDLLWTHLFSVRLVKLLYRLERPLFFVYQCLPLNWVRRKHRLPSLGWDLCRIFTDGDYTLYADVPELVPTDNLPANHQYLGPVLWSPAVQPPDWWDSLPTDRPIVYATLGSSGRKNLLQVVLNALADLPVTVIAATAGHSTLQNVPANAFVADYLPGEAAAARSAVVVCNGGSPTTQQALAAGVPVVGIAGNLDQHLNMEAVEQAGAGVLLRTERLKSRRVADAVNQVLSRAEYRQGAQRLAEAFGRDRIGFPQHVESALRLALENLPPTSLAS